jgi:hypothetical protein
MNCGFNAAAGGQHWRVRAALDNKPEKLPTNQQCQEQHFQKLIRRTAI